MKASISRLRWARTKPNRFIIYLILALICVLRLCKKEKEKVSAEMLARVEGEMEGLG